MEVQVFDDGHLKIQSGGGFANRIEAFLEYVRFATPTLSYNAETQEWEFPKYLWPRVFAASVEAVGIERVRLIQEGRQTLII